MKMIMRFGLVVASTAMIVACGGNSAVIPEEDMGGVDPAAVETNDYNDVQTSGLADPDAWKVDPLNHPDSPLHMRVIYFGFDDASLTEEGRGLVEAHAKFLAGNAAQNIVLEGHADERGTREYNIALGQQRAETVRRMMLLYGVSSTQIRVLSYGEEKPAEFGHDDQSWALNRRVEIRYL